MISSIINNIERKEEDFMKIKITADSSCDLSEELLQRYQISMLPLYIIKGTSDYKDGIEIKPADIFAHVASGGELCSTSAINVEDYIRYFRQYRKDYDYVIHLNLGSGFSSCYRNACAAAEEVDHVYIIDSENLSSGTGYLAVKAAMLAQSGMTPEAIVEEICRLRKKVEVSFVIDKLDYLKKGGRCSSVMAFGANLLNIKPCIEVVDGAMTVVKKYRGSFRKCVLQYIRERLEGRNDLVPELMFITHSACPKELITAVWNESDNYARFDSRYITEAGCTISSHCGPNTLGIIFAHV